MPILSTIVGYFKDRDSNISAACEKENKVVPKAFLNENDTAPLKQQTNELGGEQLEKKGAKELNSIDNESDASFHDACESFTDENAVTVNKTMEDDLSYQLEANVGQENTPSLNSYPPANHPATAKDSLGIMEDKERKAIEDDASHHPETTVEKEKTPNSNSCPPADHQATTSDCIENKCKSPDELMSRNSSDPEKSILNSSGPDGMNISAENSGAMISSMENEKDSLKNKTNNKNTAKLKEPTRPRKKPTTEQRSGPKLLYGITPEMIEEENKYKVEEQKQLEEIRLKALAELQRSGRKKRFARLQLLLSRSQMYSTYLLGRLNARREAEQKRLARMEKKQKEELEKSTNKPENQAAEKKENDDNMEKSTRGKRKRKGVDEETSKQKTKRQKVTQKKKGKQSETSTAATSSDDSKEENSKTDPKPQVDIAKRESMYYSRTINGETVPPLQPLLLTGGVMRSYQIEGMTWLLSLFEHGINGILADEMGLGKTLQSIAMIVSLIERNVRGPFLIAAPLSTLPNWVAEFKKFAPELYTILYHGSVAERAQLRRKMMRLKRYSHGFFSLPVVISSYEILMRDRPVLDVYNIEWKFLIVDEGHRIKNLNCKLIHELKQYNTANRLLLTGTPLQNNLCELWSLLNFLLPDIFDDLRSFQEWFDFSSVTDGEGAEEFLEEEKGNVLQTLHSILTPFLLRRLKTDVDLTIPPKKEVYVYAPLTAKQEEFYKSTLDRTIFDLIAKPVVDDTPKEYTKSGREKRRTMSKVNYKEVEDENIDFDELLAQMEENEKKKIEEMEEKAKKEKPKSLVNIRLQNIMMQLRKCCNHPYLLEYPYNPDTNELKIDEDLVKVSGKMLMLDRMLPELKKRGHKVLIFSQMVIMLDIIGDYCDLRGYSYSRIDGSMDVQTRQDNIASFADDPENFIFLLSTRSGGLGLNLMMADTCIIYDSDWNPQCDLQAQDRCHRIGQKKPVVIYRFVTANTIDQRIIERASSKRKLEKMIIHKKHFKGRTVANGISPTELLELLHSKDVNSSLDTGSNIISDEDLAKLLDRSDMEGWELKDKKGNSKPKDTIVEDDEAKNTGSHSMKKDDVQPVVASESSVFKVISSEQTDEISF